MHAASNVMLVLGLACAEEREQRRDVRERQHVRERLSSDRWIRASLRVSPSIVALAVKA